MTDEPPKRSAPEKPTDKLTRVPVHHVWFHDSFTFVGLDSRYSTISNLACHRANENENRYVTCDWIPAWQTFEFSFHALNQGKDFARVRRVSAARVACWAGEADHQSPA